MAHYGFIFDFLFEFNSTIWPSHIRVAFMSYKATKIGDPG